MKKENKIPLTSIAEALGKAMDYPFGMNHLAVLMHVWMKRRPDEAPSFETLRVRKQRDGYSWLKSDELALFERYAGYPISENVTM